MITDFSLRREGETARIIWLANQSAPVHWKAWTEALARESEPVPRRLEIDIRGDNTLRLSEWMRWFESLGEWFGSCEDVSWQIEDPKLRQVLEASGIGLLGRLKPEAPQPSEPLPEAHPNPLPVEENAA